jgi:serine/threonine protein kinase
MVTGSHPRRVVLMDFGIARAGFQGTIGTGSTYLGTPYYMAPEPANGRDPGPYSDLYSVGVVLFELLTGRRPFEGDNPIAVLQQHVSAPPPSPRAFNGKVPARLESIVVKLLAKRPEDRYQSAEQLIVELQDFARGGRA